MLERFTNSIFRHCSPDGWVKHYVFEHGGKDTKPRRSDWGRLSDVAKMHDFIEWSRQRPGTVYCPPVGTFADTSRSTIEANVSEAPALVVELDDNPTEMRGIAEAVLGPATLVVRSGGVTPDGEDKLHLYWRLTQPARTPEERAVLKAARHALGALCEADMTAVPLMHPMRWPGSWHTKGTPRLCEIIAETENELDLHAAYAVLNEVAPTPIRPPRSEPKDGYKTAVALSGEEASRLLSKIPNSSLTWDDWNRLGMTVWDATHASEEGREAWHEWSALDARYDRDVTDSRWDHYYNSPPQDLSAASLYHKAGEVTPRPRGEDMFPEDEDAPAAVIEPPRVTKMREEGVEARNGKMMFVDEQITHFQGCIYVEELDAVLCPDWQLRKQPQFNKHFGGHRFIFSPDGVSGSQLTKSAWEAFTENAGFRAKTVQRTCFRPEHEPRAIVRGGGLSMVNVWRGLSSESKEGDASPFVTHVRKLLPVGDDADMLLTFMAFCVQNPGKKIQWWPVIQGCPGNGKSILLTILRFCLGEEHYHEPDTAKMVRNGIDFNAWVVGCLFVGMEEVYASNRREFLEGFKRYVTNYSLTIRPMYGAEYTGDNRLNGMILTNHRDGVPIDDIERRYAPMFTAQQSRSDMIRDGMGGDYFPNLWGWLRADGYAIVNHFLKTYEVNSQWANSSVAPVTSSTREAVSASLGRAEQEVMETVEQGEQGFSGGWISSIMLDKLLESKRVPVPRNKRKEMVERLGYVLHPALTNGRTSSVVMPDAGKPRLYVTVGHLSINATKPSEVERLYMEAQNRAASAVAQSRLGA